jgi:hypothetical protein
MMSEKLLFYCVAKRTLDNKTVRIYSEVGKNINKTRIMVISHITLVNDFFGSMLRMSTEVAYSLTTYHSLYTVVECLSRVYPGK